MKKVISLIVIGMLLCTSCIVAGCGAGSIELSSEAHPSSGGTITPSQGTYDEGAAVQVEAIPNSGYKFDHWEGSLSGTSPTAQLTMDESKKVIACFTELTLVEQQVLTGERSGSLSPNPMIPVEEGQWVEVSISLSGIGTSTKHVRILDPDWGTVEVLGNINDATYQFTAQKTGSYLIDIETSSLVYYTITYTIYS